MRENGQGPLRGVPEKFSIFYDLVGHRSKLSILIDIFLIVPNIRDLPKNCDFFAKIAKATFGPPLLESFDFWGSFLRHVFFTCFWAKSGGWSNMKIGGWVFLENPKIKRGCENGIKLGRAFKSDFHF